MLLGFGRRDDILISVCSFLFLFSLSLGLDLVSNKGLKVMWWNWVDILYED